MRRRGSLLLDPVGGCLGDLGEGSLWIFQRGCLRCRSRLAERGAEERQVRRYSPAAGRRVEVAAGLEKEESRLLEVKI